MKRKTAKEILSEMTESEFLDLIKSTFDELGVPYRLEPTPINTTVEEIMEVARIPIHDLLAMEVEDEGGNY